MSPRTSDQFGKIRGDKISLIMDVALEHFAKNGFHATTIHHIAKHAGISKGLMYNYFDSKEALLKAIVHRSVNEVYHHLDIDRDGVLSKEEFDFFIRKIGELLNEKKYFWRLLIQLSMQTDAREQFFNAYPESDPLVHPGHEPEDNFYPYRIMKLFKDYFSEKIENPEKIPDRANDLELFYLTLLGFAIRTIYSEDVDTESDLKVINKIIELYK